MAANRKLRNNQVGNSCAQEPVESKRSTSKTYAIGFQRHGDILDRYNGNRKRVVRVGKIQVLNQGSKDDRRKSW